MRRGGSAALVACALLTARPAFADDADDAREPTAAAPKATFDVVWREVDAGRLREAAFTLHAMDRAEIAATNQVLFVVESWIAGGGLPRRRKQAPDDHPAVPTSENWDVLFADAVVLLVKGDATHAEGRFLALMALGPDRERISASRRLRELASQLALVQAREAPERAQVEPEGPAFKPYTRSYAGYVLLVDGITLLMAPAGFVSFASEDKTLRTPAYLIAAGFYFAAPTVHVIQGRPLYGLASFGLRLALPTVAGTVAVNATHKDAAVYTATAIGMVAAVILDASVLCQERITTKPATASRPRGLPFFPLAALRSEGGIDLGVGGAF